MNLTISQFPRKTVQDTDLFIVAQTVGLGGNYSVSLPINAMLADIAANSEDIVNKADLIDGLIPINELPPQVTLEGNNFNGASQLVKLNTYTQLPAIDGSLLTNLNGSVITTGLIPITVIPNTVTKLGNNVNGPNQLVVLDGSARYPALNSGFTIVTDPTTTSLSSLDSALANIFANGGGGSGSVSTVSVVATHGFSGVVANPTSTPAITLSTTVTGIIKGSAGSLVAASVSDFPILNQNTTGNAATASNLLGGVAGSIAYQSGVDVTSFIAPVANAVLITNGSGVPLLSNTLPTVNGSALTNLNASNISSGTIASARLPIATTGAIGAVKPDGVTITVNGSGVISATASQVISFRSVSTNYSMLLTDTLVQVNSTGRIITLPDATLATPGLFYNIKVSNVGNCTLQTLSGQTLDGLTTDTLLTYMSRTFYSDGSNWFNI